MAISRQRAFRSPWDAGGEEEGLERKCLGTKCRQGVTKDALKRGNEGENEISKEVGKEGAQRVKGGKGRSPEREETENRGVGRRPANLAPSSASGRDSLRV